MQAVELADTVEISTDSSGLSLCVEGADLPENSGHIAFRAAEVIAARARRAPALRIKLVKRIPEAAGLAGGSADAAAVLRGVNRLWELGYDWPLLAELAAGLGCDVPFCLRGGTALATGRGEIVTPLPSCPVFQVVLAAPAFGVSTAWVYGRYDGRPYRRPDTESVVKCLAAGDIAGLTAGLANVLESVTLKEFPEVADLKEKMIKMGAVAVLMSGSGPTVFALTTEKEAAARIAAGLRGAARVWLTATNGAALLPKAESVRATALSRSLSEEVF
jgi:4-diphosphocytidyl-2-C-methyl-D-erythritol kinase